MGECFFWVFVGVDVFGSCGQGRTKGVVGVVVLDPGADGVLGAFDVGDGAVQEAELVGRVVGAGVEVLCVSVFDQKKGVVYLHAGIGGPRWDERRKQRNPLSIFCDRHRKSAFFFARAARA